MASLPWKQTLGGLFSAATLCAQSTGVTTADLRVGLRWPGSPAPAEVRVLNRTQGTRWVAQVEPGGACAFRLLPPGSYDLEVWSEGSVRLQLKDLRFHAGTTHELSLPMPRPAGAQVSVEAPLGLPGEPRTQAAWVVDSQLLSDLPINRRNYADLSLVTPMAAVSRGPVNAGTPDSGLSFAGAGPRQNNFMVDGLDNNDMGNGASRLLMSQEAIQEFQVITSGYSAEFGKATGGVINAVTRSGSNKPEGSLFYYFRPGSLDADSPLGGTSSRFRMHQFGASASGPILKDRLFYFACAEGLRRSEDHQVTIDPAVAAAIRDAGFSLDTGSQGAREKNHSVLLKLDYLQSDTQRWGLRMLQSRQESDDLIPWGGLTARSAAGSRELRDSALALSHQWTPSAAMTRETRLMRTTRHNDIRPLDSDGTVQVEIQGAASFGTQRLTPQSSSTTYLQLTDTTTLLLGSHTLKGGIDLLNTHNRGFSENNFAGYYLFQAAGPYSALQAFQAGFPVAFVQAFGDPYTRFSTDYQSAFLQDEWRPRQDLLLRLGVRYDRERIPTFADTAGYQALGSTTGPYSELFKTQRDWTSSRFSPRFSFSWQTTQAWRLFGGFGTFMGQTNLSPVLGAKSTNGVQGYGIILTALDAYPLNPTLVGMNPAIAWGQPGHRFASDPGIFPITLVIPGSHEAPVNRQQNLGLEWKARQDLTLTMDLVYAEGSHLLNMRDVNAYVSGQRVNPAYSSIYRVDDSGRSRYTGQSLTADWRPSPKARFQASYTHSRSKDNVTDWATTLAPMNTFDPATEWGPSSQDQRHRILASARLASGEAASPWLKNWTLGIQVSMGSGRPYTKLAGTDVNQNGDGSSDRPAGVGRNSENLPWSRRVDLRLARSFAWAGCSGEASLDVFNLLNHANVREVQNVLNSTTPVYGTPTDYESMRQVQFGVRFRY